jgi:hypothetical protein
MSDGEPAEGCQPYRLWALDICCGPGTNDSRSWHCVHGTRAWADVNLRRFSDIHEENEFWYIKGVNVFRAHRELVIRIGSIEAIVLRSEPDIG